MTIYINSLNHHLTLCRERRWVGRKHFGFSSSSPSSAPPHRCFPFWYFLVLNLVLVGTCWPFSFLILYFFIFMVKFLYFPQPRHLLLHHIWYFLVLLLLLTKTKAKNGQIVTFRIPPSCIFLIQFSTFQAIGVDLCAAGCCATGYSLHPLHCCVIRNLFTRPVAF